VDSQPFKSYALLFIDSSDSSMRKNSISLFIIDRYHYPSKLLLYKCFCLPVPVDDVSGVILRLLFLFPMVELSIFFAVSSKLLPDSEFVEFHKFAIVVIKLQLIEVIVLPLAV
jgi:hypothetical protein